MADDSKPISDEEAIQRAKEEFGEETIAKFQGLPPDVKAALLLGNASHSSTPKKHAGGRIKGSGKDYAPALRRMAELQEEGSTDSFRDLAKKVNKELKAAGYTADAIRKKYRPHAYREELRAAIREERRPRTRVVVTTAAPASPAVGPYSHPSVADYAMGAAGFFDAAEEARRAILGPDLRTLLGPSPEEMARFLAPPIFPDYAQELAKAATGPGSSLAAAEEEIRRMIDSSSAGAIRGLHILLGKKPTD